MTKVLSGSEQITVFYVRKDIPPAWFYFLAWLIQYPLKNHFVLSQMIAMEHLHINNNFKQGMIYALLIMLVFAVILAIAYIVDMPK